MSSTTIAGDTPNIAGPSTLTPALCALCNAQPAKYTCPRCETKSCSLPCSRAHKDATGCSGERDKVSFVPMNQYGYASMVNDYVFLEEVGRNVDSWGREILKSGIARRGVGTGTRGAPMSMRGGRGRGRGGGRAFGYGHDKRQYLAMQLGLRDIDMDVLPVGMDKAKRNKSIWLSKEKAPLLTIEFVLKPPPNPMVQKDFQPTSLLTHKNEWRKSIRQMIRTNIQRVKKDEHLLQWLGLDDDENIPSSVLCVMKRPRLEDDPTNPHFGKPSYYKLDWNVKLSSALRYKHFVEYPTIELADESAFDGRLLDDDGLELEMTERRPKRQKLDAITAKKTITGLIGAYGSDEDEGDENANLLANLGEYSEDEGRKPDADDGEDAEDDADVDAHGEPDEQEVGDFRAILDADVGEHDVAVPLEIEDDEGMDWGDDEIAEDEAKLASLSAAIQRASR